MSLSTMGLGRFMRDMFGDQQEPWLNTAATKVIQPLAAKENTISSTNGQGSAPAQQAPEHLDDEDDAIPDEDGAFPDSAGVAMKTVLDLPRNPRDETEPPANEWNARSYPSTPPALGGAYPPPSNQGMPLKQGMAQGQPGQPGYPSNVTGPMMAQPQQGYPQQGSGQIPMPMGTTPPPQRRDHTPPPGAFATPGSGSGGAFRTPGSGTGPSLPAQPGIVSTKHGYTSGAMSRGDVSYPRYEVPFDAMNPEVQLRPNRRPLFIGLGLALFGIIVILAVSLGGKDDKPVTAPQDQGSDETDTGNAGGSSETMPVTPPDDNMVSIVIDSEPRGADVLIAGSKIGTTPFNKKVTRGTKVQELKVKLAGYVDFVGKLDLTGDYENRSIKLVHVESPVAKGSNAVPESGSATTVHTGSASEHAGSAEQTDTSDETDTTDTTDTDSTDATDTDTTDTTDHTTDHTTTGTSGTKTGTSGTKTSSGSKTGTGTKTGTNTTGTKTSSGTKTGTKTGTGTSGTKTGNSKPKCQPPGPNVDPFSSIPICSK